MSEELVRRLAVLACVLAVTGPGLVLADEPVPVGDVVADPDQYHFRLITLQGTVRRITLLPPYSPREGTTCYGAYTFQLDDKTGSIEVSVLGICGAPVLRTPEVADGDEIALKAQILSPNRTGPAPGTRGSEALQEASQKLRAIANEIRRMSPAASSPGEGDAGSEKKADAPAGDSGY